LKSLYYDARSEKHQIILNLSFNPHRDHGSSPLHGPKDECRPGK